MEHYPPDQTFLSGRKLKALAADLPTPFFLYHAEGIRARAARLVNAFSFAPAFRQYFPVHLCPCAALLTLLRKSGCGAACRTRGELALAAQAGFTGREILYSGLDAPDCDCIRIIDDFSLLTEAPPKWALLRYNPGGKLTRDGRVLCALDRQRTGMGKDALLKTAALLKSYGVQSIGLCFSGAVNELSPAYLPAVAELLFTLALELHTQHGITPDCCCLGDGLAVSLRPQAASPQVEEAAQQIEALSRQLLHPAGLGEMPLYTALGRWLLAPEAIFLTRVRAVKPRTPPLLITDAAMSQFPESVRTANAHHISICGKTAIDGRAVCDVASLPELQPFAARCVLPPAKAGDLLVFHTAGCVASSYTPVGGFPPAAQYLLLPDGSLQPLTPTAW